MTRYLKYFENIYFCICNTLKMFNIIQYCHFLCRYGAATAYDKYCSYKMIIFHPNKCSKS